MPAKPPSPVTIPDFARWKAEGRKISMLTAYDFTMARLLDASGVDCLLVGDSLGLVVQGRTTTLGVTLDQMVYHVEMVARGFGAGPGGGGSAVRQLSRVSPAQAIASATRFLKETQCQAVKLEGGRRMAGTSPGAGGGRHPGDGPRRPDAAVDPQARCGYKVQRDESEILLDARAVSRRRGLRLGAGMRAGRGRQPMSRAEVPIPTIGIGAGSKMRRPGAGDARPARPVRRVPPQVRPPLRRPRRADPQGRPRVRRRRPGRAGSPMMGRAFVNSG